MNSTFDNRYSFSKMHDMFFESCEEIIDNDRNGRCCMALDLEHFKLFNQVYGREHGDVILTRFFSMLQKLEDSGQCVASYFGQDDFALFAKYNPELVANLYMNINKEIAELGNTQGFLPAIGVYILDENEQIGWNMYDNAVLALAEAKKSRADRIVMYETDESSRQSEDYKILLKLKDAVANGQITFYLQPQCRISTQRIVGAEALARWIEPDGKLIPPSHFIPALERNGFIADFDKLIWEMVCKWIRSLLDRNMTPVPVSVNVSQTDIITMDVVKYLREICEKYDVPTRYIKVEITESSYAEEHEAVQDFVKRLRENGFVVMMDDFGAGYSSLNMLENINVDVLKLDMAFIKDSNLRSRRGITIMESIVNMAKMISLPIVVEGVETKEQVEFLRGLGCRYAQGNYFYKPLTIEDFERLLEAEELLDNRGFISKMNEQFHVREFLDENTFTDSMLNSILGAVAFYALDGKDLTITRFNEQFYRSIADASMETRQQAIQNYVVKEDWPALYRALDNAYNDILNGGLCEVRFYKSDNSVFWFRMHFFYLRNDGEKRIYYGQVEDVTEAREQSIQFFDVMREQSEVTMMINLDQQTIQYVTGLNTLNQIGLPSIPLSISVQQTAENRIEKPEDKEKFKEFFNVERIKAAHKKAVYHESITVGFRMKDKSEPMEFSTYCIRHSKEQDLVVYAFAKYVK